MATLEDFSQADPATFVRSAYKVILGRAPTDSENAHMRAALMRGDTRTWLLGRLRYGDEGRARAVSIRGLGPRYVAQCLFRLPILGHFVGWLNAQRRLPLALRQIRMMESDAAERSKVLDSQRLHVEELARTILHAHTMFAEVATAHARERDALRAELQNEASQRATAFETSRALVHDLAQRVANVDAVVQQLDSTITTDGQRIVDLERSRDSLRSDIARLMSELRTLADDVAVERQKLLALLPPPLAPTLEVVGDSLVASARKKHGIDESVHIPALSPDERYALFEAVFYDTDAVAAKQRIYLPYLDRELTSRLPFLDLGCGRGEFSMILRGEGIATLGVDVNESNNRRLRSQGFNVVSEDIVAFLERDHGTYSGAAILQVVEHLAFDRVERMLELLHKRLAPNALLLLETPNPLSAFALSVFHSDPTHIRPLPPEALRYTVEAAGFDRTRTLYQARIPVDQFAGPDARAYYADYAIIANRSAP